MCCITLAALAVVVVTMKRSSAEPRGGAVVEHEAVLAQHQAVARPADGERWSRCWCRRGRGTSAASGPCTSILPSVETSQTPTRRAHRPHLAVDALEPVGLAGPRIPLRAQPVAGLDEHGALLLRPVVRRRQARRAELLAAMSARRARRSRPACRAGGRSWCRSAGWTWPVQLGHEREAGDVGGLALVGRHAERGVALQVLDRAEALALGERDVVGGDVVLEVDEGLAARAAHAPERRRTPCSPARPRAGRPAGRVKPQSAAASQPASRARLAGHRPVRAGRRRRRRRVMPGGSAPGTKAAMRSFQTGLPPRCEVRCSVGLQPPDTQARSQSMRSVSPVAVRDIDRAHARRADARARRRRRRCSRAPAALAAASMLPGTLGARHRRRPRRATPARAQVARPCAPSSSLVANTTARRPGATA